MAEIVPADVERGVAFTYYGPRRGWLLRRGVAAGVVVGVDLAMGIVHVRTLRSKGEVMVTDIGHIPILWSSFRKSVHVMGEKAPRVADDASSDVAEWRARHARGEVGAFRCALWEAERMAWESLPDDERQGDRDALHVAYAYPTRDASGDCRTVEVGVHRHQGGAREVQS